MTTNTLKPVLSFEDANGHRAGADRFLLLERIAAQGSIRAAAEDVGLSYRGAWDAVNALNNLFPKPLVIKHPGGKHGGGAEVSEAGKQVIAAHARLSASLKSVLEEMESVLFRASPDMSFNPVLWSLAMKTSARNAFHGVVKDIKCGPVNAEVTLSISENRELTTIITNHSVESLGLKPGRAAIALIKASAPLLVVGEESLRTSARNRLTGHVASIKRGDVNADVVLDLGNGKTLSVIITSESVDELGLNIGVEATAVIKASQILIGVDG